MEMKSNSKKKWKHRTGVVYSTDPEYQYTFDEKNEETTLSPSKQTLYVALDRKQRKGKTVTLISGFVGSDDDCNELARLLKSKCGTGGSVKGEYILIQGNFQDKVIQVLNDIGYKTKKSGG
jgi:translation initiation factor 1